MNSIPAARRAAGAAARTFARALLVVCIPLAANAAEPRPAGRPDLGRKVFTQIAQPACAICHTLKDAGSKGTIGPALDELKPDAQRVTTAVRKGLGVMPPYEGKLTPEQIAAVAAYISRATGAAK